MKNKRNPKKQRRRKKSIKGTRSQNVSPNIQVSEYEITYDPIENKDFDNLPQSIRDQAQKLYHDLFVRPRKIIPDLRALIKKYPHVPLFHNYLVGAYNNIGEFRQADALIVQNYERNRGYLFAKAHYAELCLHRGELEKIPAIFDDKFDLKLLYPERDVFHVSEVTAFMGIIGRYCYEIGERQSAEACYKVIRKIAPRSPHTKKLKKRLHPSIFQRMAQKLAEFAGSE